MRYFVLESAYTMLGEQILQIVDSYEHELLYVSFPHGSWVDTVVYAEKLNRGDVNE